MHLQKVTLDKPVEWYTDRLAALTPGFAGADIANLCNEAALVAARNDQATITLANFEAAVDRVIGGLEKKNKVVSETERTTVAYHEAGHAVVGWFLEHAEPLMKVSIVPRGTAALGFAQYLPNENLLHTTEQMLDMMAMTLGGRAAEQIIFGKISTGAQNDLERITKSAYALVTVYGMNDKIGLVSFPPNDQQFDKPYSDETANEIDKEVRAIIDGQYTRTLALLEEKRDLVEALAQALLKEEVLNLDRLTEVLGERPFKNEAIRNIDRARGLGDRLLDEEEDEGAAADAVPEDEGPLGGPEGGGFDPNHPTPVAG